MLDEFEDKDLAQCSDTWDHANQYNIFSTATKENKEENNNPPPEDEVNPSQTPDKLKEAAEKMQDNLKNPYFYLYHWCEGELFDIQAVLTAIA